MLIVNATKMITRLSRWCALACGGAACLMTTALFAQGVPARFPVTPAQVADAMGAAQLPSAGAEIRIAARISSAVADPLLQVQSMSLLSSHTAQLRIVCQNHFDCVPFYVSVVWPEESEDITVPAALSRTPPQSKRPPVAVSATPNSPSLNDRPAAEHTVGGPKPEPTLRNGTQATLLMEDGRSHIRVKVVCLESGVTGDRVRVATTDRKRAYTAEVLTPTTLKGSL